MYRRCRRTPTVCTPTYTESVNRRSFQSAEESCMRLKDGQGRRNRPKARKPEAGAFASFTIAVTCRCCCVLCGFRC